MDTQGRDQRRKGTAEHPYVLEVAPGEYVTIRGRPGAPGNDGSVIIRDLQGRVVVESCIIEVFLANVVGEWANNHFREPGRTNAFRGDLGIQLEGNSPYVSFLGKGGMRAYPKEDFDDQAR